MIQFFVEGKPVGKQRPRSGKNGFYTPKRTVSYERHVALCALSARMGVRILEPLKIPLKVDLEVYIANQRNRPDIDNIIKSVLDGMNEIIYIDDRQVDYVSCKIIYAKNQGVQVKVYE